MAATRFTLAALTIVSLFLVGEASNAGRWSLAVTRGAVASSQPLSARSGEYRGVLQAPIPAACVGTMPWGNGTTIDGPGAVSDFDVINFTIPSSTVVGFNFTTVYGYAHSHGEPLSYLIRLYPGGHLVVNYSEVANGETLFNGLSFSFPAVNGVTQIVIEGSPPQGSTFHSWDGATDSLIYYKCGPSESPSVTPSTSPSPSPSPSIGISESPVVGVIGTLAIKISSAEGVDLLTQLSALDLAGTVTVLNTTVVTEGTKRAVVRADCINAPLTQTSYLRFSNAADLETLATLVRNGDPRVSNSGLCIATVSSVVASGVQPSNSPRPRLSPIGAPDVIGIGVGLGVGLFVFLTALFVLYYCCCRAGGFAARRRYQKEAAPLTAAPVNGTPSTEGIAVGSSSYYSYGMGDSMYSYPSGVSGDSDGAEDSTAPYTSNGEYSAAPYTSNGEFSEASGAESSAYEVA